MTLGNWFDTPSNQSLSSQYSSLQFASPRDAHEYLVRDGGQVVQPARGICYSEHGCGAQAHRAELGYLPERGRDSVYTTASYVPGKRSDPVPRSTNTGLGRSNAVKGDKTRPHARPKPTLAPTYTTHATLNEVAESASGEPALYYRHVSRSKSSIISTESASPPIDVDLSGYSYAGGDRFRNSNLLTTSQSSNSRTKTSSSPERTIRRVRHHSRLWDDYEYDGMVLDANRKFCSARQPTSRT